MNLHLYQAFSSNFYVYKVNDTCESIPYANDTHVKHIPRFVKITMFTCK